MTKAVDLAKTGSLVNSSGQIDLTTGVTGVLPVANGGTGSSSGVSPGGSTTQVQYNNAGAFGADSGFVYSSGNVGIGTSSPASPLDIQAANGQSMLRLAVTTGTNAVYSRYGNAGGYLYLGRDNSAGTDFGSAYAAGIWSTGAYPMLFGTNGTEKMRLDSSGNLGLGVTPSAWGLFGGVALQTTGGALSSYSTGNITVAQNTYFNGSNWIYKTSAPATYYQQYNGVNVWNIAASGTAGNAITFTQAMTLDASGNLGIGTSSPSFKLQVTGSDTSAGGINVTGSGTDGLRIFQNGSTGNSYISNTQNGFLYFGTNNTERMRIASNGAIGIGGANYGTSGQVLVSQGSGSAPVWGSGGKVVQVVQTVLATAFSATTSGNTFTNITGLSVNITPSSASNKILILVDVSLNSGGIDGAPFRITRGGTAVGVGSPAGTRQASTGVSASNASNGSVGTVSGKYLDSPATTSQITYQIQALSGGSGGTFYVNRTASYSDGAGGYNTTPISTITVMEIAA